ncbi:phage tail assembly chaperone [Pantoea sp. 18069]|uniref:phage tail assembly chaperone n=1 Tax=Pantoea sp. 18069 TaxID=2681415 RepID=UPI00135C02AC|nr:phage tail assembly chaperone [Pantoea sp. 18069]
MTENTQTKPPAFIFGARPETIDFPVKFKSITGADVDINCQFQYRTRKEFAALWDEFAAPAASTATPGVDDFSFSRLAADGLETHAARTLKFLKGWPLDLPLDAGGLVQMFDEEPAAAGAFWNAYRAAITEGRLGN